MDSSDALSRSRYRERRLKNFNTLPIHDLHAMQLQVFVYKFVYHRDLLPAVFHDYFTLNKSIHEHGTRAKDEIHIKSVNKHYGKISVKYKGSTLWNSLLHKFKKYVDCDLSPKASVASGVPGHRS